VAQTGESVIVNDVREDKRFFSGIDEQIGFHTTSLLAAPLRARGTIMGTLELVNKRDGDFDEHDRMFAEALAASAAIAFDNARLIQVLRHQTTELAARNEELDAFTHSVAHQLKNPLSYVTGYASILEAEIETLSPDSVREFVRTMDRSARRMSEIIDGLLLLAHVRQEEVESEPLDMEDVVTEAQHRLNGTLERYSAEIITPEMWPEALGYRPWVEEVWVNYISNAIKYGGKPEEGIPPRVELGFDNEEPGGKKRRDHQGSEPQIRFWVRDNGSGIAPEEQDQLFIPFKRLHLNRAKGHGLGLATVRRIVEKLGGRVGVESEVGRGSDFSFTLPAADGYE
jgi:signal transduction histidine kinase